MTRLFLALALGLAPTLLSAQEPADRIWHAGTVLTMEDASMRAEAIAEKDGRILAVGSEAMVMAHRGPDTEVIDLAGRALLPGFVDSHGHVVGGGLQALSANLLSPPDGEVRDIESLQQTLRDWAAANADAVEQAGIVIGFGYDPAQLAEQRHPTRTELDAVAADMPVYIVHQSGHLGVANSAALEVLGWDASTSDPDGGVIRREEDGAPDGVLEETAHFAALVQLLSGLGPDAMRAFAAAGAEMWASFGYTTAQEGRAMPSTVTVLEEVAAEGGFDIDIVAFPDVQVARDLIVAKSSDRYVDRLRVGGGKLSIDGSPQGFTAWRDRPYHDPVGNYPPNWRGYASVTDAEVVEIMDWAYANDVQVLSHSNGEAASDMLIAAIEAAQRAHGAKDIRPVLIHGQFMRVDQVDAINRLGVFPSFFPMHTFYWGDWHREHTVGPARADDISPTGWAHARGMTFGTHHDAPVALPDSMRVLSATVTRRTRSGDILGADQRVDVITALKAMTIWPAWQHFEESQKGSLVPGKLADFVILSDDPTAVDPEALATLQVAETIKEGKTIWARDQVDGVREGWLDPGHGVAAGRALAALAIERDLVRAGRTGPVARALAYAAPHGPSCVSGFLADLVVSMARS